MTTTPHFSASDRALLRFLVTETNRYYELTKGDIKAKSLSAHYDRTENHLLSIRRTKNPVLSLMAEGTVMGNDARILDETIQAERKANRPISPELQSDATTLQKALQEIGEALRALAVRNHDPETYHTMARLCHHVDNRDGENLAKDVVRKCLVKQVTRLRNMAKGNHRSVLDRKLQTLFGTRAQNMVESELLYKADQKRYCRKDAPSS